MPLTDDRTPGRTPGREHGRRALEGAPRRPGTAYVDRYSAHDWRWSGDVLEVVHVPVGVPVRDAWYRRGEVLHLEARVEVAR